MKCQKGCFNHVVLAVCLLSVAGCGGNSDVPPLGSVTGKLILDGEPTGGVMIRFSPAAGGRSSVATSEVDGSYTLIYNQDEFGASVGTHNVTISIAELPEWEIDAMESAGLDFSPLEKQVDKYLDVRKEVQVESGSNAIDLQFP